MITLDDVVVGSRVHYQPDHYKENNEFENGIVKEIREDDDGIFVVYNCAGDWKNYQNYTSAKTNLRDLNVGWK